MVEPTLWMRGIACCTHTAPEPLLVSAHLNHWLHLMRGKAANSCLPAVLTLQQALAQVAVTESRGAVGLRFDPRCLRAAFDSSARWDLCGKATREGGP